MMLLPGFIQEQAPLAPLTTFRVGGAARYLARPADLAEVRDAIRIANELKLSVLVLGGGSNLLIADAGVEAMVVRPAANGDFGRIEVVDAEAGRWRVGAAVGLQNLVAATVRAGRAGLESMAGIPGFVGGAVTMNAGAAVGGIGLYVRGAEVVDLSGGHRYLAPPELAFSYRMSTVKDMTAVVFDMEFPEAADPDVLSEKARECRERKLRTQPLGLPSAGCVFKNPSTGTAGALLDAAGCKGMSEGNARVSDLHANFIVTGGPARAHDIAVLALRMRDAVWERAGEWLEPEIALWGDEPAFASLKAGRNGGDAA